jgi:hypothetical protein
VGRIPLDLLDTNLQENAPADRDITARLYGSGSELGSSSSWCSASRCAGAAALNVHPTVPSTLTRALGVARAGLTRIILEQPPALTFVRPARR